MAKACMFQPQHMWLIECDPDLECVASSLQQVALDFVWKVLKKES